MWSEARAIWAILGFKGVQDFSAQSDVNHCVITSLFVSKQWRGVRFRSIFRCYTTLHAAYVERREQLTPPQRALIVDFMRRWVSESMKRVQYQIPVRWRSKVERELDRHHERPEKIKAANWAEINAIKWES